MKTRFFTTLIILLTTAAAFADKPVRRTVVIRDGKVVSDGNVIGFEGFEGFGGKRAFLGVSLMDLTPELREHFGGTKASGVLVGSVEDNSPAAKAGLRVGDVITAIDGKDIDSSWDLRSSLRDKKENETVRVDYIRNNSRHTAVATLVEREARGVFVGDLDQLPLRIGEAFKSPEWRARVEQLQNCGDLQSKLQELERKMKELEKKLSK
jgi:membrane-associated protease RseP (regulator of RpoE activity)